MWKYLSIDYSEGLNVQVKSPYIAVPCTLTDTPCSCVDEGCDNGRWRFLQDVAPLYLHTDALRRCSSYLGEDSVVLSIMVVK